MTQFKRALEVGNKVSRSIVRREIFEEIASDEVKFQMIKESLVSKKDAINHFGKDHGLVRVMAVKFYRHLVHKGDRKALINVLTDMAHLSQKELVSMKDREDDFRDLYHSLLLSYKPRFVGEEPDTALAGIKDIIGLNSKIDRMLKEETYMYITDTFWEKSIVIVNEIFGAA